MLSEARFCVFHELWWLFLLFECIDLEWEESAVANCRRSKPQLDSVVAFRKLTCLPNERLVLLP